MDAGRPAAPAATASRDSRQHKWGLVLETIHFALAREARRLRWSRRRQRLQDKVRERPLLGDGAMGTQLMIAGLEQGNCGEAWNLTHPERVLAIQRRYAEAGSDCIITNTFGGSRIMLNRHGHAGDVAAINRAGVEIAREAFGGREGWVLGDIGPFGGLMEPYGDFTEDQVRRAFAEQAEALVDAGADAIIIETQTSLEELQLAHRSGEGMPARRASSARWPTTSRSTARRSAR